MNPPAEEQEQQMGESDEMMSRMAKSIFSLLDEGLPVVNDEIRSPSSDPTSARKVRPCFSIGSINSNPVHPCSKEEWYGLETPDIWPTSRFDFDTYPMLTAVDVMQSIQKRSHVLPDGFEGTSVLPNSGSPPTNAPSYPANDNGQMQSFDNTPSSGFSLQLSSLVSSSSPPPSYTPPPSQAPPAPVAPATSTFMVRNIPNKYTRKMMLDEIEERGCLMDFDFFYLPIDFRQSRNVGYAFINLVSEEAVANFKKQFDGAKLSKIPSSKVCLVSPAKVQGQMQNADQYRYSTVMKMPEEWHPVFYKNGERIPFPKDTRRSFAAPVGNMGGAGYYMAPQPQF